MNSRPLIILCIIGSFLLGGILGICFNNFTKDIEIKFEINLAELITILTTIGLAIYIKVVLDRKSENTINISHLISNRVETIYPELNELKNMLRSESKLSINFAVSLQKKINTKGKDIERFLIKEKARLPQDEHISFISDFTKHTAEIKDLTTNTPSNSQLLQQPDIMTSADSYIYSGSRVELILQEVSNLESLLLNIQYTVYSS